MVLVPFYDCIITDFPPNGKNSKKMAKYLEKRRKSIESNQNGSQKQSMNSQQRSSSTSRKALNEVSVLLCNENFDSDFFGILKYHKSQ